jgi:hypothetical protein
MNPVDRATRRAAFKQRPYRSPCGNRFSSYLSDFSSQRQKGSYRLQPKANHLLFKKFLPNFPEIARAEELCITKRQIFLKLPGVDNTTTILEYTTLSERIARA